MQSKQSISFNQKQITNPEAATPQPQQGKPLTLTNIFPDKAMFTFPKPLHFPFPGESLTLSNNLTHRQIQNHKNVAIKITVKNI